MWVFFNYSQSYIIGNLSAKERAALMGTEACAFCRLKMGWVFFPALVPARSVAPRFPLPS